MAKGIKTGGRNFTSETAALAGAKSSKALPPEIKEARKLRKADVEKLMHDAAYMTSEEIQAKLRDKKSTALELMILKIVTGAINKSDQVKLQFLLDRTIGPLIQKTETDVNVKGSLHDMIMQALDK